MSRRSLACVLVVLMLVVAGCTGAEDADSTETPTTAAVADATDDASTVTAADTTTAATDDDVELDTLDTVVDAHEQALRDAGSFAAIDTQSVSSDGQNLAYETEYAIDLDGDRSYSNLSTAGLSKAVYTAGDATYLRSQSRSGDVAYEKATEPYDESSDSVAPTDVAEAMGTNTDVFTELSHERAETTTRDGTEVTVYVASGQEAIDEYTAAVKSAEYEETNVTRLNSTLAVDDDGIIRYWNVTLTHDEYEQEETVELIHRIVDVGDVAVEEPPWLSGAKDATDG